jgi:crotonobetainyl-CoA:carnitine CoA-transferase CaiB-like acyl-CoA transferase
MKRAKCFARSLTALGVRAMMLSGIRVVELGQILAAPFAAEILGDLGAEVIKVEKPGGDDARQWGPPFWDGDAALFHQMNRNKQSVVLDLKDPEQYDRLVELIASADVFIHNLRPGSAKELGLDPAELRKSFPRLIYADLGAFGHVGPMCGRPGYELLVQAFGGPMSVTGETGGSPVRCGPSINDLGTGMWAAIGILSALVRRGGTGEGCLIQTSLFETALCWVGIHVANYLASGKAPERQGAGHPSVVPYQIFETKTGSLIVAAGNDRLFAKLADLLGHPEWKVDPRYVTNGARVQNRAVLEQTLHSILAARTKEEWAIEFEAAGIPCSPVLTIPEVLVEPQTDALGMLQDVPDRPGVKLIGLPLSFNGERPQPRLPPPKLGAQSDETLGVPAASGTLT